MGEVQLFMFTESLDALSYRIFGTLPTVASLHVMATGEAVIVVRRILESRGGLAWRAGRARKSLLDGTQGDADETLITFALSVNAASVHLRPILDEMQIDD